MAWDSKWGGKLPRFGGAVKAAWVTRERDSRSPGLVLAQPLGLPRVPGLRDTRVGVSGATPRRAAGFGRWVGGRSDGVIAGFRFGAVDAGLKKGDTLDLALAVADAPVPAAGVFTRNLVRAAPCDLARERLAGGRAQAILVNSGCANACTGAEGLRAAAGATRAVAESLGIADALVLPASTGVIGKLLPVERVAARAADLVATLRDDGTADFADAIRTTDRFVKVARASASGATVLGIAKGAGMYHPNLATMLAFLFTDARLDAPALARLLPPAVARTFNESTVDGDTSTNDCVFLLASGRAPATPGEADVGAAIAEVCEALARMMVRDGEGANHCVEFRVSGLARDDEARRIAVTVATSLLVKTAIFGKDPNWGRILGAAGRSGVAFDPTAARIEVEGVEIVRGGIAVGGDAEVRASERMSAAEYRIDVVLGDGPGKARYLTSDVGHGYVDVNAGYRT